MHTRLFFRGLAACCALLLAAGCAGKPVSEPYIARSPAPWGEETLMRRAYRASLVPNKLGVADLRCADLRETDLSGQGAQLLRADFDSRTQWPQALPEGVDPAALMELGRDPGLGVRALHAQGVTGQGVGIAIIDQTLLTGHREYAGRLRYYEEFNSAKEEAEASMHGSAVASIALGEGVGVAPGALLYYVADDLGTGAEQDMTNYAADIDRLVAMNAALPEGEKIRIISISAGCMPGDRGAAEMDAAVARARSAGVAVIWVSDTDPLSGAYLGLGREPYGDPDSLDALRPGLFWEDGLYGGDFTGAGALLVPMDRRTTASPTGTEDYAYYINGGTSWAIPYVAGLYALACQVKPDVTFEAFTAAARATARPVSITAGGKEYPYGSVVDPAALLEALK